MDRTCRLSGERAYRPSISRPGQPGMTQPGFGPYAPPEILWADRLNGRLGRALHGGTCGFDEFKRLVLDRSAGVPNGVSLVTRLPVSIGEAMNKSGKIVFDRDQPRVHGYAVERIAVGALRGQLTGDRRSRTESGDEDRRDHRAHAQLPNLVRSPAGRRPGASPGTRIGQSQADCHPCPPI